MLGSRRALPPVNDLVDGLRARLPQAPRELLVDLVREELQRTRDELAGDGEQAHPAGDISLRVEAAAKALLQPGLRRVINATGVVLHTNLGRAPLAPSAVSAVTQAAGAYTNLELDLQTGKRGMRGAVALELLRRLTGAEAALALNNNAGAVLLALTALCRGGDVLVSRGQLVEIGGGFRMPEVMRLSGARLVEVGSTNRTHIDDYAAAVSPRTRAILRVHPSNYRMTGYVHSARMGDLARLARESGLLLIDDCGSGSMMDFDGEEPLVRESVAAGADVVCFSGDKLLGGPQAGLAVGHADALSVMARHPLARALRIDRLQLAALEATLREWVMGRAEQIPAVRALQARADAMRRRAEGVAAELRMAGLGAEVVSVDGAAGGGALPESPLPGAAVALTSSRSGAATLSRSLRLGDPPVIALIEAGRVVLDLRAIPPEEEAELVSAVVRAAAADS